MNRRPAPAPAPRWHARRACRRAWVARPFMVRTVKRAEIRAHLECNSTRRVVGNDSALYRMQRVHTSSESDRTTLEERTHELVWRGWRATDAVKLSYHTTPNRASDMESETGQRQRPSFLFVTLRGGRSLRRQLDTIHFGVFEPVVGDATVVLHQKIEEVAVTEQSDGALWARAKLVR